MKKLTLTLLTLTTLALAEIIPISTLGDLAKIGHDPAYPLDGHYRLMNDIDASPTRQMDGGRGWLPIGDGANDIFDNEDGAFHGIFDGGFKSIRGLYINRPEMGVVALFATVMGRPSDSSIIKNWRFRDYGGRAYNRNRWTHP